MQFGDAFDALADVDTYTDVAAAGAGYFASRIVSNLTTKHVPANVPEEANGLAVIAATEAFNVPYQRQMQAGAGTDVVIQALDRVGYKNTIASMGA